MAESFSNKLTRAAGLVVTKTGASVAALTNQITVSSNTGIYIGQLVDNQNFIAGTKVSNVSGTTINTDTASLNSSIAANQNINFLGVTTAFSASATEKSILIGGTFANNTNNRVELTVELFDNSASVGVAIASKIPVPAGSSFVISDTGKTLLEGNDALKVYCDVENAIDANISILTGVN